MKYSYNIPKLGTHTVCKLQTSFHCFLNMASEVFQRGKTRCMTFLTNAAAQGHGAILRADVGCGVGAMCSHWIMNYESDTKTAKVESYFLVVVSTSTIKGSWNRNLEIAKLEATRKCSTKVVVVIKTIRQLAKEEAKLSHIPWTAIIVDEVVAKAKSFVPEQVKNMCDVIVFLQHPRPEVSDQLESAARWVLSTEHLKNPSWQDDFILKIS